MMMCTGSMQMLHHTGIPNSPGICPPSVALGYEAYQIHKTDLNKS